MAQAWAKLDQHGRALPLVDHGEDVAAVMQALLTCTAYRARLEAAAERSLAERDVERLCGLAFLHDLGKANIGFWRRQFPGAPMQGHTEEVSALFEAPPGLGNRPEAQALIGVLAAWGAFDHFVATLAHHGRPLVSFSEEGAERISRENDKMVRAKLWRPADGYDPLAELTRLLDAARARFPLAFVAGPPLPDAARFVSLFAGLMTLADWLGSDSARFPVAGPHGEARRLFAAERAEDALLARGLDRRAPSALVGFEAAFGFAPYEAQAEAADPGLGPVAVLEAETGSGKTEAALWRYLRLQARGEVDGLYFALPTRTAATQLHARVNRHLRRLFGAEAPQAVLAVPGYLRAGDEDGRLLAPYNVLWSEEGRGDGRWAAEAPKRYLAARVAVGTVDQVLLAGLQVKHAHLRAAALSRALLVVDEVHASDIYMTEVLKTVIANHVAVGGRVLLLSATLGGAARAGLLGQAEPALAAALQTPYPALSGTAHPPRRVTAGGREKRVRLDLSPTIADPGAIAARALAAAREGASVLVIRNTVDEAVAVAQALEEAGADGLLFRVSGVATLHHGRFAPEDRALLDAEVEAIFGKADPEQPAGDRRGQARRPVVLVGSQTLEQSLDIDADLLLTDLAPIDVLLQRLGRLHRHVRARPPGFERPRAIVLTLLERDLRPLLQRARHGLGPFREGRGIYGDLRVIEATWALLEAKADIAVPADCRGLVEAGTHPDALAAAASRTGLTEHMMQVEGRDLGDRDAARRHRLDMDRPFLDLLFPQDEAIRTRLGADDRLIDLPKPLSGPFGAMIARLRLPGWIAKGIGAEPAVAAKDACGGLQLLVDGQSFLYDRFGLRRGEAG